jgi:signal peptidase I
MELPRKWSLIKVSNLPVIPPIDHLEKRHRIPYRNNIFGTFVAILGILIVAPLIAIILTTFVFQSYQVDGQSMQNTLQNNDRLIVWKLPRTWAKITGHQYVPKRGDIVIFTQTNLNLYGDRTNTKQLVKRVIGLPGDRVVVKNMTITIYDRAYPHGFQPDKRLGYASEGGLLTTGNDLNITIGHNQMFVCGDNRPESLDSRYFGPVNTNQIIGKLIERILPLSTAKRF